MWYYKGEPFTGENIKDYFGFVYLITNKQTGKMYVGRKYFWHTKKLPPLKGRKRKRIKKYESDWKTYYGSCDELKEEVELHGSDNFHREILRLCKTRAVCNYGELEEQFKRDVLYALDKDGNRLYYNNNILGRYFPNKDILQEKMNMDDNNGA